MFGLFSTTSSKNKQENEKWKGPKQWSKTVVCEKSKVITDTLFIQLTLPTLDSPFSAFSQFIVFFFSYPQIRNDKMHFIYKKIKIFLRICIQQWNNKRRKREKKNLKSIHLATRRMARGENLKKKNFESLISAHTCGERETRLQSFYVWTWTVPALYIF